MTETVIRHDGTAYRCGVTTNGLDWMPLDCRHLTPREAIDHVPASRPAHEPVWVTGPHRGQGEALDMRPDAALSTPDGRGDRYSPRPADAAHPAKVSMSGTLGL